jgi:hypothetical protein
MIVPRRGPRARFSPETELWPHWQDADFGVTLAPSTKPGGRLGGYSAAAANPPPLVRRSAVPVRGGPQAMARATLKVGVSIEHVS